MYAIVVEGEARDPQLVWREVPPITPGPGEVLVDVVATAVNRADLAQARGQYPPPPGASEILGLEMAGVIAQVGADVSGWQVGESVCALLAGGGYAERVVVPAGMLLRPPTDWPLIHAAAAPEVWYTAYINLFLEGGLTAGESVLIHAGASGVGTAAIQLAHAAGAQVLATAGTKAKLARCRALGADEAIHYKEQDFLAVVLDATEGQGVDLILDPVGGAYLERNVAALRHRGRLVNIGLLGGVMGELNLALVLRRHLRIIGSTLRSRPLAEKVAITRQFEKDVWPRLTSGELQLVIDRIFPIQATQAAHAYVRGNHNIGKVLLQVREEVDESAD